MRVDGDQVVQILARPVLAAKLRIQLARTVSALDQGDEASLLPRRGMPLHDPGVMEEGQRCCISP